MAVSYALDLLEILIRKDIPVFLNTTINASGYFWPETGDCIGGITLKQDVWANPNTFIHEVAHVCQYIFHNQKMAPIGIEVTEKEFYFWVQTWGNSYSAEKWGYEIEAEVMGSYRYKDFFPLLVEILETLPDVPEEDQVYECTRDLRNPLNK